MTTTYILLITFIAVVLVALLFFVTLIVLRFKKKSVGSSSGQSQVYVGNLPYHVGEDELEVFFGKYGHILSVRVIRHSRTGRSKGYAFLTYDSSSEARSALVAHGKEMEGRVMVVRIAKSDQRQG